MSPILIVAGVKVSLAVTTGIAAHLTTSHLALLYANHAAATVTATHAGAGQAMAAHGSRVLPAGHHPGTHPMSADIKELLAAAGTIGTLTFVSLYDHMIDEVWKKAQHRVRDISVEELQENLNLAYMHTKRALRHINQATADEKRRLDLLMEQLRRTLRPMPPGDSAAPA
jgi:hypothetical protein